jgi:hypothetical protein
MGPGCKPDRNSRIAGLVRSGIAGCAGDLNPVGQEVGRGATIFHLPSMPGLANYSMSHPNLIY